MITTGAFLVLMLVGVPIGLCLCLGGIVYIWSTGNPLLFQSYPLQMFGGVDSYGLIAIPLFILIGEIMNGGGITRRIIELAMAFVGSLRGGLAYVNVLANMFVSSILGSATAQVAIMAQIMVPEMEKKGYDKTFAAGLTAYGGMLGPIIPPSVMFVVYSVLAQVAVSDMLIAGLIPGIVLTVMFCVVIAIMGYFHNFPRGDKMTLRERVDDDPERRADADDSDRDRRFDPWRACQCDGGGGGRRGGGGAGRPLLDARVQVLAAARDDAARRRLLGDRAVPGRGRCRVLVGADLRKGPAGRSPRGFSRSPRIRSASCC